MITSGSTPSTCLVRKPELVVHADWSKDPKKRWCSAGVLEAEGHYRVCAPAQVGHPGTYFSRLRARVDKKAVVLTGFDFPIGLPARYASEAGLSDFRTTLPRLGRGEWRDFYTPAQSRSDISLTRPFYPNSGGRAGEHKKDHLVKGLGLADKSDLKRRCERRAESLFWLIGAKQVGKAAISGWKDLLAPALASETQLSMWPFDGHLSDLLERSGLLVITETYPAEMYGHVGLAISRPRRSKRSQSDRAAEASTMRAWAHATGVRLTRKVQDEIEVGFGSSRDGEDRFDAVVGLFGMLDVVLGNLPSGEPHDGSTQIEGWILGYSDR